MPDFDDDYNEINEEDLIEENAPQEQEPEMTVGDYFDNFKRTSRMNPPTQQNNPYLYNKMVQYKEEERDRLSSFAVGFDQDKLTFLAIQERKYGVPLNFENTKTLVNSLNGAQQAYDKHGWFSKALSYIGLNSAVKKEREQIQLMKDSLDYYGVTEDVRDQITENEITEFPADVIRTRNAIESQKDSLMYNIAKDTLKNDVDSLTMLTNRFNIMCITTIKEREKAKLEHIKNDITGKFENSRFEKSKEEFDITKLARKDNKTLTDEDLAYYNKQMDEYKKIHAPISTRTNSPSKIESYCLNTFKKENSDYNQKKENFIQEARKNTVKDKFQFLRENGVINLNGKETEIKVEDYIVQIAKVEKANKAFNRGDKPLIDEKLAKRLGIATNMDKGPVNNQKAEVNTNPPQIDANNL